jgi:CheY-like chemotaxis protein
VNTELPPVLAAEDEETDAAILRIAFERARILHPLIVVRDGQEAVDYLAGKPPFSDRANYPIPILLLLDVKMPRLNGFDVLAWLAGRPDLQNLPAIVLSSSWHDRDVLKARQLGARDYFIKPIQISEYIKIIQGLGTRWLTPQPGFTAPPAPGLAPPTGPRGLSGETRKDP